MSDAEHLIENAIMALELYPFEEAEQYFMEKPINIMMSKDIGCPLNAVWEMAIYCDNEDIQSGWDCADYLTNDLPDIIDNLVNEMTEEQ